MLEPNKRKINYLHTYEEQMSPSAPRREGSIVDNLQLYKGKQTATQANKIAVDLGQHQKPVTLFVPHSKSMQPTAMSSFSPIVKVIEEMATLDEHCKQKREQTPLLGVSNSYESSLNANSSQGMIQPLQVTSPRASCCNGMMKNGGVIPGVLEYQ